MQRMLPLALIFMATVARPALATELKFVMPQGARAFAATLGAQCLSDAQSSIEASGQIVTVRDRPDCATEIREIAGNWVLFAEDRIVTYTGTPDALTMVRQTLEQKLGRSPSANLRFLARTQTCRCLAFVGKRQADASVIAERLLPQAPQDAQAKTTVERDRVAPQYPGQKDPFEGTSQDLIKDVGSALTPPPSA